MQIPTGQHYTRILLFLYVIQHQNINTVTDNAAHTMAKAREEAYVQRDTANNPDAAARHSTEKTIKRVLRFFFTASFTVSSAICSSRELMISAKRSIGSSIYRIAWGGTTC
jgi:hypothetical protein